MQDLGGQKGRKPTSVGIQAPAFTPFNKKKCGHHGSGWMKVSRWGWEHPGSGCGPQEALVLTAAVCGEAAQHKGWLPATTAYPTLGHPVHVSPSTDLVWGSILSELCHLQWSQLPGKGPGLAMQLCAGSKEQV